MSFQLPKTKINFCIVIFIILVEMSDFLKLNNFKIKKRKHASRNWTNKILIMEGIQIVFGSQYFKCDLLKNEYTSIPNFQI